MDSVPKIRFKYKSIAPKTMKKVKSKAKSITKKATALNDGSVISNIK